MQNFTHGIIPNLTNILMKYSLSICFAISLLIHSGCDTNSNRTSTVSGERRAKFEPPDGKCLLFVGQELESIGGLKDYNTGYMDYFDKPAGFTMYTKIRPGDQEFGFTYSGLAGVHTTDDWGDGDSNMSLQISDPNFSNMALAIGLEMVNHEEKIAEGRHDSLVLALGYWIKSLSPRPVFLRIGYEFHGPWNHYDRRNYIKAYRHIVDLYREKGIDNVAYVWQSHGFDEPLDLLEDWYPGDQYVDWCGYSFFARWNESNMIEFAKKHGKPVFIGEATPTIGTATVAQDGKTKETILFKSEQAEEAWQQWFKPFFAVIHDNPDTVKAVSYINCNWKSHRMWMENPTFQNVDARLQTNPDIAKRWIQETSHERYIKSSENLYESLHQ